LKRFHEKSFKGDRKYFRQPKHHSLGPKVALASRRSGRGCHHYGLGVAKNSATAQRRGGPRHHPHSTTAMSSLKGKAYKLLYELNKDTLISVRTPVGVTVWGRLATGGDSLYKVAICSGIYLDMGLGDFISLWNSLYEMPFQSGVTNPA
jgi:hypothetical protein